jgi:hypothetical protein
MALGAVCGRYHAYGAGTTIICTAATSSSYAPVPLPAPCSHGSCTYDNGNHYEGEWVGDKRHGWGLLTAADGDVYEGEWAEDCPHGEVQTQPCHGPCIPLGVNMNAIVLLAVCHMIGSWAA